MGFFRYLTLLFCLCTITLTQAQRYEVDCLVSSEIKAVATDKPTEFDGSRTVLYLCNGTLVNVVGRKVAGTDGKEASHLKQAGDTLDVRQIKAVIEYDGKHYLAEARWLKFFFGTAGIGKFSNAYKQKWVVRDGKLQNVSILHQGDRIVESAAALTRRMLRHRLSLDVVEG